MSISVLIPYAGGRDRLHQITSQRIVGALAPSENSIELIVYGDRGDHPDLFNHAQAVNRCAERASGDVFLIMEPDTTFDRASDLVEALHAASDDRRWRLPTRCIQLTQLGTHEFLSGRIVEEDGAEWIGDTESCSGLMIVPREAFELVGGADERYRGSGADDVALGKALNTLYAPVVRYDGAAVHLWRDDDDDEAEGHRFVGEQHRLTWAYDDAAGDVERMRALVEGKTSTEGVGEA